MSELDVEKLIGKSVFLKKKFSSSLEGTISGHVDTIFGKVLIVKSDEKTSYVPISFISKVSENKAFLKKGVVPFPDEFWEHLEEFTPSIMSLPFGVFEGIDEIDGKKAFIINLKFALPKTIEAVWNQIKEKLKKKKVRYLHFMEAEGYPFPLCYHPRAIAEVAERYNFSIPDDLFAKRVWIPVSEGTLINNTQVDFPKYPTILKMEIEKPDFYSIEPPSIEIPTYFKYSNVDSKVNLLKGKLETEGFSVKRKNNTLTVTLDKWYFMKVTPTNAGDLLVWHIDFSVKRNVLIDALRSVNPVNILFFGVFGLLYEMRKTSKRLPAEKLLNFLDNPLEYEPAKKALSIVRNVIK
ncbi:MAG: hypothetical protein ACP6IS_04125 [Candidatus Asgardarchaeia archaeon]